jgi:hypothetical protein
MDGWNEVTEALQDRISGDCWLLEKKIRELQDRVSDEARYTAKLEERIETLESKLQQLWDAWLGGKLS